MKLVHVIIGLGVGGAELMLLRLVQAQRQADPSLQTSVVSLTSLGVVGERLRAAGIDVHVLGMRSQLAAPATAWKLYRLLRRLQPDLVQTWMVHADLIGGLAARAMGVRAVLWGVRTTDFSINPLPTRIVRALCARLSSTVPLRIACAAEASRKAHVQAGYDASRMVVIPNGFDLEQFVPGPERRSRMRAALGLADDEVVFGCLGRWNIAKDQPNFVAAAARVAQQHPQCRFLMIGRGIDGPDAPVAALVAASGCAERFIRLGERRDVADCLAAMDVLVLPSRSEGFPNVVGEAMAMQLPCVVTDVGDAAWLVGDTGLVVAPRDAAALAAGMMRTIASGADWREQLGRQARARIVTEFSLQRSCARFSALQAEVLALAQRQTGVAV